MIDKNLWHYAKLHIPYLAGTIISGCLCGGLIVGQAYGLALLIGNVFIKGQNLEQVLPLLLGVLVIITLRALLSWLEEWLALQLARGVQTDLRRAWLDKIERLGPVQLKTEKTGELLYLFTEGLDTLQAYFGKYLPQLFKSGILPLLFLGFIFPQDLITGLILAVTAPMLPVFMVLIGRWAEAATKKQWQVLSRMTGYFQDILQGLVTLKMLNQSRRHGEQVEAVSEDFRRTSLRVLRIAFLSALTMELFSTISIALVAVGLGVRLVEGMLGFQIAFFLLLLAPEFYLPIRSLGNQYHASLNGVEAAERIFRFLAEPEEVKLAVGGQKASGRIDICFEEVDYQYEKENLVLKQVSFTVVPGEKVALVGSSGGGKSTILHLLMGFITPGGGRILVGGQDLAAVDLETWRTQIAWIPQKPYILAGTIKENLLLGQEEITGEELAGACRRFGLQQLIEQLPEGYETRIGPGGRPLSGGQEQLLAITRAGLKQAPVLLLDEATANLDLLREDEVQRALSELMEGKTVLAVAHRLQTISKMDKILVLEAGCIAEMGAHQELLRKDGPYRALWYYQKV
jgi:ATP-binding cassette subfamily C protein CydD